MMGYKKYKIIVFFLSFAILCGCALPSGMYSTPNEEMKQQMMTILQAVIDKDVNTIEELFCPYIKEHDEQLQEEITALFEFIDGDIISYDEPEVSRGGGTMAGLEGYVKMSMSARINVYTSTGKMYQLGYGAYPVYKEKPDYVGVTNMVVYDEGKYNRENGYPEEEIYRIFLPEMFE